MKRNNIAEISGQDKLVEHKQRVAFHEAGHAAGIYLNNKLRQLPPVFFKIMFKDMSDVTDADIMAYEMTHDDCIARVEGGRLIECLPPSTDRWVDELTGYDKAMEKLINDYKMAFDADIINLLIGPLAEAKHVADSDDELFNHQLVNLRALKNYGGRSDLALANEYLDSYSANKEQKDNKLDELFNLAFDFVNNDENWAAITQLAHYILSNDKNIIGCEEVVSILDDSVERFKNRRRVVRNH
ncbi:MAG: hypothetical protein U1D70_15215 [Methylobacter sp.]|nr:hypothetical protein [Methylobacter sp.]MDP2426846.1 hypothetical protein [Methylobacter sp.]MDP3053564.1 hypothetical protein [Methylobacter sp.]MDP3360866.1 hypothetical protein [Methylobacter sp.]MDZ4220356.1 hypothetical protein [Methylobacter sp.]